MSLASHREHLCSALNSEPLEVPTRRSRGLNHRVQVAADVELARTAQQTDVLNVASSEHEGTMNAGCLGHDV